MRSRWRTKAAVPALVALAATLPVVASNVTNPRPAVQIGTAPPAARPDTTVLVAARRRDDFAAMQKFRPGYSFWRYVFSLPDHSIAYGSAVDGRLLVTFPTKGNWPRDAAWTDSQLLGLLDDELLSRRLGDRRDQVAAVLEHAVGPVQHNSTRGDALTPNAARYGRFLAEWAAIYERFGVPADIGLAQVILESGLSPSRRSEANAIGFCQWLRKNWKRLDSFSPTPIEGGNQTTQAPYCAAYLSILATKYGSFIPALSEHNAGGTNVGRTLINGEHLGGDDVRSRYFLGSRLARDLRALPGKEYEDVHRSYGPRSYLYAEMVFGNTFIVNQLMTSTSQVPIHAMRTSGPITLPEITARTGLTADEVRRFNPALDQRVPAASTLYLPAYIREFGEDVAFWRRPPGPSYMAVLNDFVALEPGAERWDDPAFAPILAEFRRRFSETGTEEGTVMATVLAYAMDQAYTSGRRTILTEFRRNEEVSRLITRGVTELQALSAQGSPPLGF
jgi:hypothetical protein